MPSLERTLPWDVAHNFDVLIPNGVALHTPSPVALSCVLSGHVHAKDQPAQLITHPLVSSQARAGTIPAPRVNCRSPARLHRLPERRHISRRLAADPIRCARPTLPRGRSTLMTLLSRRQNFPTTSLDRSKPRSCRLRRTSQPSAQRLLLGPSPSRARSPRFFRPRTERNQRPMTGLATCISCMPLT